MPRFLLLVLSGMLFSLHVRGQIAVDVSLTPTQLVENILLGGGVTVSNVSYNGVAAPGTVQVGSGSFTGVGTNLGLAAGLILSTGEISSFHLDFVFAQGSHPAASISSDGSGTLVQE